MGKLFSLDDATKSIITDALDDVVAELGKDCRLVYPARWTACSNCFFDAATQRSTNRWRSGGPIPFTVGVCPLCKGDGRKAEEVSEVIQFKVEWEPRNFWFPIPDINLRVPHSVCQTKGYVKDIPKVVMCDHMVVQVPIEGYVQARMKLLGQPISPGSIIQGRYFVASWEQKG